MLEQSQSTASALDVMLVAVQHSLQPWHNLIRCRFCLCDDDQTVLFISVMTMRSMLDYFQRLCLPKGEKHSPSDLFNSALGTIRLGNYEVTKHEQALITRILVARALDKIKHALLCVKGKFFDSRGQNADANLIAEHRSPLVRPQIDVECVWQLLQTLDRMKEVVRDVAVRKDRLAFEDFGQSIEGSVN